MNSRFVPFIAVLMLGGFSAAQATNVLQESRFVDIPARLLPDALQDLGWQTNLDIICDPQDCKGIAASRLFGTQTVRQALDILLRGSNLRYDIVDTRSIGIFPTTDHSAVVKRRKDTAAAQVPSPPDTGVSRPEIVITGSNISGVVEYTAPKIVYSRRVLEESGYGSVEEFLSHLPQNLNLNTKATYGIGDPRNGARGSAINLRGLGERGTLVLIDGHRIAASAMGDFVDVSLIPFAAVERIEILTDGAAAIYGADAVAGVVNIVLRRDFTGGETDVRNAWPYHSGANELSMAQTGGRAWSSGNLVSSVTYRREGQLLSTDRPYSNTPGYALLPMITDYDGYLFARQKFSPHLGCDIEGLYTNRHTVDDADYVLNGMRVGPYKQRGVTNQYYIAPALKWSLDSGWNVIADFDLSQNRFTEMTTYTASGGAVYSTLSEARVRSVVGKVDGPFLHLPAEDARLALGVGERWEDYHSLGTSTVATATGSLRRQVAAAYGEVHLPVISSRNAIPGFRTLNFSMAVRTDRYSAIGSTSNPKFGFLWRPVEDVSIRGSYGTSFAIARYSQTLLGSNALVIQRPSSSACASGSCLIAEEFGANPTYRPERSRSYTVAIEWTPDRPAGLQMRANYYAIKYSDQIAAPPDVGTLLAHAPAFAGVVVPNPTPAYLSGVFARAATYPQGILNLAGLYNPDSIDFYIDERTRNFAQTLATGIDFDLGYDFPCSYGVWSLALSGTRILKLEDRASPVAPEVSVADTFASPLSRRFEGRIGLRASRITVSLRANYLGPYVNNGVSPSEAVSRWATLDARFALQLSRMFRPFGGGARLELSIDNALNREPPRVRTPLVPDGYDPVLASPLGRVIALHVIARL